MTDPNGWHCPAYGPQGTEIGALCFLAGDLGERVCATEVECGEQLAAERVRVYDRIGELAAAGDATGKYLAAEIESPEQLLGGPRSHELLDPDDEPEQIVDRS